MTCRKKLIEVALTFAFEAINAANVQVESIPDNSSYFAIM